MRIISSVATMALALLFVVPQAYSQENRIYIGAELGSTKLADRRAQTASSLVSAVGGVAVVTQDSSAVVGRIFGGYKINENVGLELGYDQTNSYGQNFTGVSRTLVSYSGTVRGKNSGFDYSLIVRPSVSTGLNGLFFRVGGHNIASDGTVTLTTGNVNVSSSASSSGSGYLAGLGYDAGLSKDIDLRFSYTRLGKVSGVSGSNADVFSIGILKSF